MAIEWKTINPDFSDSAASMRNAVTSLSQAGTVFGEMRKSILEEEQRALENAYKQQVFDENVRQFEAELAANAEKDRLNRAWDQEKLQKTLAHQEKLQALRIAADNRKITDTNNAMTVGTQVFNDYYSRTGNAVEAAQAVQNEWGKRGYSYLGLDPTSAAPLDLQGTIKASFTPEGRFTDAWRSLENLSVADKELAGDKPNGIFTEGANIYQYDPITGDLVKPSNADIQRIEALDQFRTLRDTNINKLKNTYGFSDEDLAVISNNVLTQGDLGRENALLLAASRLNVDPDKVAFGKAITDQAKRTREIQAHKAKLEADRAAEYGKDNSEGAFYSAYSKFITDMTKEGKDISSEMMASLDTLIPAMVKKKAPVGRFERMLSSIKAQDKPWIRGFNENISDKDVNEPTLKLARAEFIVDSAEEAPKPNPTPNENKPNPSPTPSVIPAQRDPNSTEQYPYLGEETTPNPKHSAALLKEMSYQLRKEADTYDNNTKDRAKVLERQAGKSGYNFETEQGTLSDWTRLRMGDIQEGLEFSKLQRRVAEAISTNKPITIDDIDDYKAIMDWFDQNEWAGGRYWLSSDVKAIGEEYVKPSKKVQRLLDEEHKARQKKLKSAADITMVGYR